MVQRRREGGLARALAVPLLPARQPSCDRGAAKRCQRRELCANSSRAPTGKVRATTPLLAPVLMSANAASSCNVRVVARFRPFNKREKALKCRPVHTCGEQTLDIQAAGACHSSIPLPLPCAKAPTLRWAAKAAARSAEGRARARRAGLGEGKDAGLRNLRAAVRGNRGRAPTPI